MDNLLKKSSMFSNLVWHFAEKWGCQIVSFVITIIISRLLNPEVYGVVAIINAFTQIFTVFIDGGLGNALIQKKDVDELDFSTVFYSNLILCTMIYLLIYISAPLVASYYKLTNLTSLLRVSSITILISALKNVQQAYVSKKLIFKKFFFASLTGTIGAGVVGIYLAYNEYGPWSLVISNLFDVTVDTLFLYLTIDWKPKLMFSFVRFKQLFNYGWKVLLSALIDRIYNKMYHLVIGKVYTSEDLAYYDKGNSLTSKIADNTDSVISSVLFPVMSNMQDDKIELKKIAKRTLQMNMYIMTPLLIGLIAACEPMVKVLLTDKWLLAVPYIRLFCLINLLLPFNTVNTNVIKSIGKSELLLKNEVIKKVIGVIILIITIRKGAFAIVIGKFVLNCTYLIINSYSNKKDIDYGLLEQIKDNIQTIIFGTIMGASVYLITYTQSNSLIMLLIQIIAGGIIYVLLSALFKNSSFIYLFNQLKRKVKI